MFFRQFLLESENVDKRLLEKIGDYSIFLVNSGKIRKLSEKKDSFNFLGTHLEFDWIPDKEIWISNDITEKERPFIINRGLNQYEAKKRGNKDWKNYALKQERTEREKVDGIKFIGKHKQNKINVYDRLYCTIGDMKVWLVDGHKLRDLYRTQFAEGGNAGPYPWVPEKEIWIEKDIDEKEQVLTILHEYVEYMLMRLKKYTYPKAHKIAIKVDYSLRNSFTKKDLKTLTPEKALTMARKYI